MTTPPDEGSGHQPPAPAYQPPPPYGYQPAPGYPPQGDPYAPQAPGYPPQDNPYAPQYPAGWEVYPAEYVAPAPPPRRRWILVAAVSAAVVAIGIVVAVAVSSGSSSSSSSSPSEAALCGRVAQGSGIVSSLVPGATVSITPGGTPLSSMPAPPSGATAQCTMTLTLSGRTVTGYLALYRDSAALASFRSSLQAAGYVNANAQAAASSGAQAFVSTANGNLALLLSLAGQNLIEELTIPSG